MDLHNSKTTRLIFFCAAVLWATAGSASGQSDHRARLVEEARREGKLIWYTSLGVADSKQLLDAFEKEYPFLKTQLFRSTGERTMNRIMTETQAGRWEFDVVSLSAINILIQRKLISPYVSPEAQAHPPEFKDPVGYWAGTHSNYFVIGYNTSLVSAAEAPKHWEDLLDPKWKGKIAIDQEEYPWYATLLAAWGREKTQRYMQAMAKQHIQWRSGHTLMAQLVAAGEFPLALVYAHNIEVMKQKGAPVDWVNTLDPIVVSLHSIALSAKPNNPNAAKLFIDFVLSKKGQLILRSFNRNPARSDIEPFSPKMDPKKLKLKVIPADVETRYKEYIEEFRRFFGL